jgi:hypothetical protein
MILTDYYKFVHLPDSKSKMRRDCIASTQSYNEFESLRNKQGELFIYFGDVPQKFNGGIYRRANKAITKGKNISSIFVPDVLQNLAYGDIRGTKDAILIQFDSDCTTIEIFVARGQKNNSYNLWLMFVGGELNNEISKLKSMAVTETVTMQINKKGA